MNHTQFLCYGLLKIFLKEAIDVNFEVKGLICSYFLKTSLFWEITTTINCWNPLSLLSCFWNCFCRLLQWISCSYCPNFFIPQNNMFEGKIEGLNRNKLLQHLRTLYYEGYTCLLRCQSLSDDMSLIMHRPVVIRTFEPSTSWIAMNIVGECYSQLNGFTIKGTESIRCLVLHHFATVENNSFQRFQLKSWLKRTFIPICMSECNISSAQGRCNRSNYRSLIVRLNVLQRFAEDSVCHTLYQAMLCYNSGKNNQTLRLVQLSKEKMSTQDAIYFGDNVNIAHYTQVGGEHLPLEVMLRKHFVNNIRIKNCMYISELYIENRAVSADFSVKEFSIPPMICALFLQYLCQRRLGCHREAVEALYELSRLVHHGNEQHIDNRLHGISWQVLGICQQMNGDDRAACRSYLTALQQNNVYMIKVAACLRLGTILVKYF